MRTEGWLSAGAALLLVVGVLGARGGSAAAEEDLLPVAGTPSAVPSVPQGPGPGPVVLEADGLPGARLGTAGEGLETAVPVGGAGAAGGADLPGGCVPAWSPAADGSSRPWDTTVWLVDGLVASVVLISWDPTAAVLPGLRTWLGPTLGSPVTAAAELPGARTRTERPSGQEGPAVTVVHVPGDGVEVVFSDATSQTAPRAAAAVGRITTVEVRRPAARSCSIEAFLAARPRPPGPEDVPDDLVIGPDGLTTAPVGTPVADVRALPGIQEDSLGSEGCGSFHVSSARGGAVRLVVLDGAVVQAQAYGPVTSRLPVQVGDPVADVRLAYPGLADRQPDDGWGSHEVVVGQRVLGLELAPGQRWVPDVDVAVSGGPAQVQSLTVRDVAVSAAELC